jgi:hypothetical protein
MLRLSEVADRYPVTTLEKMWVSLSGGFLTESAANLHMTHLSDLVVLGGVDGTRDAINFLRSLRDMFAGTKSTAHKSVISTKWDGAPAIVCGEEPGTGDFFVAKKGAFNKTPKIYKTHAEVDADMSGDLADKMKLALDEFSKLGIKGIIQGDFLYAKSDLKTVDIDGVKQVAFHPNTIAYTVPLTDPLAKAILKSKVGVVWHTRYVGNDFATMKATFGEHIVPSLKSNPNVWMTDATFDDVGGAATFTAAETEALSTLLTDAGATFRKIPAEYLNGIAEDEPFRVDMMTFVNSKIRAGESLPEAKKAVTDFSEWYEKRLDAKIESIKTERGKGPWIEKKKVVMAKFSNPTDMANVFHLYSTLEKAKDLIVAKMSQVKTLGTFVLTKDGYKVTDPEGYVAISEKNHVKLVNRLTFSYLNFSKDIVKGWTK